MVEFKNESGSEVGRLGDKTVDGEVGSERLGR